MLQIKEVYFSPSEDTRRLFVWLPDGYEQSDERYPVMYMFDGHNLFLDSTATYGTCWGLSDFFLRWPKPMICVGIECSHRGQERLIEYCPYHFQDGRFGDFQGTGVKTLDWIVNVLKPEIDRTYRTYSFREATGIGGSSMGGLMSLFGVIRYNQVFSKAACLSSTVSPFTEPLTNDIRDASINPDTRVFLSWGDREGFRPAEKETGRVGSVLADSNRAIETVLREKGAVTQLCMQQGGCHCEADWAKLVPVFMDFLWRS